MNAIETGSLNNIQLTVSNPSEENTLSTDGRAEATYSSADGGRRGGTPLTLAERDKMLMNIQDQLKCKKSQLKEDFKRLKADVKENPYLQVAIEEYEKYFNIEKQQIQSLKNLLKVVRAEDRKPIEKQIALLEK